MFTESIFLRRDWDQDKQIIARDLKCIRDYPDGYWVTVSDFITAGINCENVRCDVRTGAVSKWVSV